MIPKFVIRDFLFNIVCHKNYRYHPDLQLYTLMV